MTKCTSRSLCDSRAFFPTAVTLGGANDGRGASSVDLWGHIFVAVGGRFAAVASEVTVPGGLLALV